MTPRCRPLCQPQEVHLPHQYGGISWIIETFTGSMCNPSGDRINPRYSTILKCTFHTNMVEYLGFILSPEGLHMDPVKVSMIQAWPVPCNVCKVQSFLGFANFY